MKLPEQIYVWNELPPEHAELSLNIMADGSRPFPDPEDEREYKVKRVGVYQLVREVELAIEVIETPVPY
jgi:hypothetical protein